MNSLNSNCEKITNKSKLKDTLKTHGSLFYKIIKVTEDKKWVENYSRLRKLKRYDN